MELRSYQVAAVILTSWACTNRPPAAIDPDLAYEISQIKAIDHHAHPVRAVGQGEPADRGFDALPVDNMEPMSDPLALRAGAAKTTAAAQALYKAEPKSAVMARYGEAYPAWVLDQLRIDIMLANRVEPGRSVESPRFRWVAYADALIFPLDNATIAERNSDRKAFFALEDVLRKKYLDAVGLSAAPSSLAEYLTRVVTPTLERQRQGGAVAEKFEAAYLRSLRFDGVERAAAERIYAQFAGRGSPSEAEYKPLQDFLFRYVAAECGRLGMAVHLHTGAGAGGYYDVNGGNPLNLESVLNEPSLRKTNFVMVHGGWPFAHEAGPLLTKPNAWLDFSAQSLLLSPQALAATLRGWLELVPEKVMFGTDAYPYSNELGWEESGWIAVHQSREALGLALTAMMRDGGITQDRARELARMVMRDNARKLYGF